MRTRSLHFCSRLRADQEHAHVHTRTVYRGAAPVVGRQLIDQGGAEDSVSAPWGGRVR